MERNSQKVYIGLDIGGTAVKAVSAAGSDCIPFACRRVLGRPIETALEIIREIEKKYGASEIAGIIATGSGAKAIEKRIPVRRINEFQAIAAGVRRLYPDVRTVFEIGGQTSKYILLDSTGIVDYGLNGDCAAGTGSFIDQQATRLHFKIEDVGEIAMSAKKSARIAGRCSVFAKSDMVHAQQRGYLPEEVLKGLCLAVARNFKAVIVKGRKIIPPVLFIGGVAKNSCMRAALEEIFSLGGGRLVVPADPEYLGAMGAVCEAKVVAGPRLPQAKTKNASHDINWIAAADGRCYIPHSIPPLSTKNVVFLREKARKVILSEEKITPVYMGIDIGSVSTNLVILDKDGGLVHDIYTMTRARPIEVVAECLKEVAKKFSGRIEVSGVGTTGSGRELIGELVGADTVRDEITAHKTGALYIAENFTGGTVDTIFEIGGQDSKFIRIENGVVVDFAMNEACAAGTGSFLEEQAERLGVSIKDEFARLALSSKNPLILGERCTVFMERDVSSYQMKGARTEDITAGLAYSIALNYLNRVVRGRKIGDNIFFQGGTAYNAAVAAAFANVTGKRITVPPANGVIGAIGAALLAKAAVEEKGLSRSRFRGFDITKINYHVREFTCKACTNECDVQEFTVDGSKTYWGDKCSSKYRKKAKVSRSPVLADLVVERMKILLRGYSGDAPAGAKTVGIPRAMYFFDRFPFWNVYLTGIGFKVVLSDETNKKIVSDGISLRVAEPCHPIAVAHGHVKNLMEKDVDFIWLPNILTAEPNGQEHVRPYLCPWGITLPYVISAAPSFQDCKDRFLMPTLHHMHGWQFLSKQLFSFFKRFGVSRRAHNLAIQKAALAQKKFREDVETLGGMAMHKLNETGREAIVLVGRPYNILDPHINLNIAGKIRSIYGVDVIPMDILPQPEIDVRDVADRMFWNYGKKIIAAAKFLKGQSNLHVIYVTNFKCGPDSFVKHFAREAYPIPFLTLQFDEHSNDAGVMTRVEAYLDSKGLLTVGRQRVLPLRSSSAGILRTSSEIFSTSPADIANV